MDRRTYIEYQNDIRKRMEENENESADATQHIFFNIKNHNEEQQTCRAAEQAKCIMDNRKNTNK